MPVDPTLLTFLAVLFLVVALVHTSVGLGGGSSYTAIMAICGLSIVVIPTVSLSLNIVATTVGAIAFIRHGHAKWKLILPFLLLSIPFAYLGGSLVLSKSLFYILLLISLIVIAILLITDPKKYPSTRSELPPTAKFLLSLLIGATLGFLAGAVGIGGGIYLVPLIILLRLGTEKQAAACGTMFIWLNSCAGMTARIQHTAIPCGLIASLAVAVIIGSAIGSTIGASKFRPLTVRRVLAGVIIVASLLLTRKILKLPLTASYAHSFSSPSLPKFRGENQKESPPSRALAGISKVVTPQGFEPCQTESKSVVLPLHHGANLSHQKSIDWIQCKFPHHE